MAVTVVHLESQQLASPAAFQETPDGAAFTARVTLTVDGQPVTGRPGRGASKKTARQRFRVPRRVLRRGFAVSGSVDPVEFAVEAADVPGEGKGALDASVA